MACKLGMGQSPSADFPIEMVKTELKLSVAHEPEERIPKADIRVAPSVAEAEVAPTHTSLHASSVENNQSFVKNQNGYGEAPR